MNITMCRILLILVFLIGGELEAKKQIALTFDDAPRPDSSLTSSERTNRLLSSLEKSGVNQVMFFVTTKHLNTETFPIINQYKTAGHLIANHSDQHLWLSKTELSEYQNDFLKADAILNKYPHFKSFFRFPYLDEGRDQKRHVEVLKFLQQHNYQNGYVTVDNYDWYLDRLYQLSLKSGQKVDMEQLKKLYVDVLWQAIQFSDEIAIKYLGRSPSHVLLLHDNDLAALYIADLIAHIKSNGWEIISPVQAFNDPISKQIPDTLFNGQGRVAALARVAGAEPRELVHDAEDEDILDKMYIEYGVSNPPDPNEP